MSLEQGIVDAAEPSAAAFVSAGPSVLVIMGVSGSGKSTVAALLAGRLGWEFEDGDAFHPKANVDKMQAGLALTDEDRWPWLHAIAAWIDQVRAGGQHGVVACSALRRAYRDILVGTRNDVRIVYLSGDADLIGRRMCARSGHFMPPTLLSSQLATLEAPGEDERPIEISIDGRPQAIVDEILAHLRSESAPL